MGVSALRAITAAAQPSSDSVRVQDLHADLFVLTAGSTNALAFTSADGVALVDGGSREFSAALLQAVESLPRGGPVHTLFNTHWHPEQSGSNETVGRAGGAIVAQRNTCLWLQTDVTWPWNEQTVEPLEKEGWPTRSFFGSDELTIGGTRIRCAHLPDAPHTDGDMYVSFPEANVIAVGDLLDGNGWQTPDWWTGGWIGGLVGGLEHLLIVANPRTRIVPARGPVLSYAQVQEQFEMYSVVWERLAKMLYSGKGPDEAVLEKPTQEFDAKMGNPDEFVNRSFRSMWAYLTPDA